MSIKWTLTSIGSRHQYAFRETGAKRGKRIDVPVNSNKIFPIIPRTEIFSTIIHTMKNESTKCLLLLHFERMWFARRDSFLILHFFCDTSTKILMYARVHVSTTSVVVRSVGRLSRLCVVCDARVCVTDCVRSQCRTCARNRDKQREGTEKEKRAEQCSVPFAANEYKCERMSVNVCDGMRR